MTAAPLVPSPTDKMSGARAFARSLNILLKHVRLYGLEHRRSVDQFEQAWKLLQSILGSETGFLFGIGEGKLLLDGVPLEGGPSEQSFAKMLSGAGIASIHFSNTLTVYDFRQMVTAFANSRPSELLSNLQAITKDSTSQGIRVNEVRFVAHDGSTGEPATVAGVIAANTISALGPDVKDWLKDPRKLLQLISAAQGTHGGVGNGSGTSLEITPAYEQQPMPLHEQEVVNVIRFLSRMGAPKGNDKISPETGVLQQELNQLDTNSHSLLYQVLFSSAANSFDGQAEMPDLLKLAEHLAIRFAVESYERGEVKINAVQTMLERLNQELQTLRRVLNAQEDKMARAGLTVESHAEILDRQFWAAVPDWGKKNILLSDDSWCIPARNIRSYIEQLLERRDQQTASAILQNYLTAIESTDIEARRKSVLGISELADLYGRVEVGLLQQAILKLGRQLAAESTLEMQTQLSAAFVHLNLEASAKRDYLALEQSLCSLARVETQFPNIARDIKPRISVQSRLRDFVAEVQRCTTLPQGLVEVLRRTPGPTAEEIATQFLRCSTREEAERYVELVRQVGEQAIEHLRHLLVSRAASDAVLGIGLLTRLDAELLFNELPMRVRGWSRQQQDTLVRQIAASGANERGELLLALLDQLDTLILPQAIDEIGLTGNAADAVPLLDLTIGRGAAEGSPYVQLKSIEAIGRLRIESAEDMLVDLLTRKSLLGFTQPRELRVAAMQALQRINPERAQHILPKSGLDDRELSIRPLEATNTNWLRQRRYQRVVPGTAINATAVTPKGKCQIALERISLGGGFAVRNGRTQFGTEAVLEMQTGFRHLRSRVLVREVQAGVMFEIVDIGLEERGRLRKLIAAQISR